MVSIDPRRSYLTSPDDAPAGAVVASLGDADQLGPGGERYCWWQATVEGGRKTTGLCAVALAEVRTPLLSQQHRRAPFTDCSCRYYCT